MSEQGHNRNYYINSLITVFLMFGFGYLPAPEPMTQLGMKILGVFLGLLYAWSVVDFTWPSLLGMIALGYSGYAPMKRVFAEAFGADLVLLVFFSFVLSSYLSKVGLTQVIANWFVSRKINIGRPWMMAFMMFLAAYILGSIMSVTAAIIILWSIYYELCAVVGLQKRETYPVLVLLGIVYSASAGYTIFPFKPMAALVLSSVENSTGLTVDPLTFICCMIPFTLLSVVAYVMMCKYIFRPDVHQLKDKTDYFAKLRGQKLTMAQKIAAGATISFIALAVLPSMLPDGALGDAIAKLGMTGSLVLALIVVNFLRFKDGEPVMNFIRIANTNISWDIVLMLAVTTPVSNALKSPEAGILDFIVARLGPIFGGLDAVIFSIAFVIFSAVITQLAHNLVMAALLTPIMCTFAAAIGADPLITGMMMAFVLNLGIVTPGASTPGALAFANRAWISAKQAYGYNIVIWIMNLLLTLVLGRVMMLFFLNL